MPVPKHLVPAKPKAKRSTNPIGTGGTLFLVGGLAVASLAAISWMLLSIGRSVKFTKTSSSTGKPSERPGTDDVGDDWGIDAEFQDEVNESGLPLRLYKDGDLYFPVYSWRLSRGATGPLATWFTSGDLGDGVIGASSDSPAEALQQGARLIQDMLDFVVNVAQPAGLTPQSYPFPFALESTARVYNAACYAGYMPGFEQDGDWNFVVEQVAGGSIDYNRDQWQWIAVDGSEFRSACCMTATNAAQMAQAAADALTCA